MTAASDRIRLSDTAFGSRFELLGPASDKDARPLGTK